jgi:hypothetical protein
MPDPKKPTAGRDVPLPSTSEKAWSPDPKYANNLSRQKALRDSNMKKPIQPSYPELLVFGAVNAVKGAKTAATMKKPASFSLSKAAKAFGADLGVDAAVDYDRSRSQNKKK